MNKIRDLSKGFRSFEVPRLETEESKIVTTFENVITSPNLKPKEKKDNNKEVDEKGNIPNKENLNVSKKLENLRLLKSLRLSVKIASQDFDNLNMTTLSNLCNQENKRFKDIIYKQTNNSFLKSNLLPSLKNHEKEVKMKIIGGRHKIMGEHYNPFTYSIDNTKSSNNRNVTGCKFNY